MKNKIVVIGSSNVDLIMKMDRLPAKGETVTDAEFMQVYGGKGANQAVAAARAGGNITFVSCVGEDAYTPQMVKNYFNEGMDTRFVFKEKGIASGYALIMIGGDGDNIISVAPGANYRLLPNKIDEALQALNEASMIVMQYEIPEETIKYVIDKANERNIPMLFNFAPARDFDFNYIPKVDIFILNETEASILSKIPVESEVDAEKAATILIQQGVKKVIVTLGTNGALVVTKEETIKVPAFKVEAIDTTAAGDTFCGTLAVGLVEGLSLQEALQFASAAAAISVTRLGAQPSAPSRTEIQTFLDIYSD